jgi:CRP/FNR family transcriptional regulator, cyclic AMP receptor protein
MPRPDVLPSYGHQSFLKSLEEGNRSALLELGHACEWRRGESLFYAGARADNTIVLSARSAQDPKAAAEGAEVVLALLGPGDLLGEYSAGGDGRRSASATALDSAQDW